MASRKKISQLPIITNPSLSGVTAIVDNGVTYQASIITLKEKINDDVNDIKFNTGPAISGHTEGRLFWDNERRTLAFDFGDGSTLQIGQEEVEEYWNWSGVDISNGQAVYITGAYGTLATCALAMANIYATSIVCGVANFNTPQVFANDALSIAVVAGDILEIKMTTPTLSQNGSAVFVSGTVYIE